MREILERAGSWCVAVLLCLCVLVAGCGKSENGSSSNEKPDSPEQEQVDAPDD